MSGEAFVNPIDCFNEKFEELESPRHNEVYPKHKPALYLTDLPTDCLMHVFSKINIQHHNRIRSTCRFLKKAQNQYLRHEFMKAIYEFKKKGKDVSAAILSSIDRATEIYVKIGGFESTLFDCLLPLICRSYRTPFDLGYQDIKCFKYFLIAFFDAVDSCMNNPGAHYAVVLYMQTILNVLRSFPRCEIASTETASNLSLHIVVPNIMITTLRDTYKMSGREKCNAILIILTLLLISSISMKPSYFLQARCVNEFQQENFVFASNAIYGCQEPKTEFKINLQGSDKVRVFFKNWLSSSSSSVEETELPHNLSDEQFQFDLEIFCKSEYHWGCPPKARFIIVPKF